MSKLLSPERLEQVKKASKLMQKLESTSGHLRTESSLKTEVAEELLWHIDALTEQLTQCRQLKEADNAELRRVTEDRNEALRRREELKSDLHVLNNEKLLLAEQVSHLTAERDEAKQYASAIEEGSAEWEESFHQAKALEKAAVEKWQRYRAERNCLSERVKRLRYEIMSAISYFHSCGSYKEPDTLHGPDLADPEVQMARSFQKALAEDDKLANVPERSAICTCPDPIVGLHAQDHSKSACAVCGKEYVGTQRRRKK